MKKILYLGVRCLAIVAIFLFFTLIVGGSPFHYWPHYLGAAIIYVFVALFKESNRKGAIIFTSAFSLSFSYFAAAILTSATKSESLYLINEIICIIIGLIQLKKELFYITIGEPKTINRFDLVGCLLFTSIINGVFGFLTSATNLHYGMSITTITATIGIMAALPVSYFLHLINKGGKLFFLTPA